MTKQWVALETPTDAWYAMREGKMVRGSIKDDKLLFEVEVEAGMNTCPECREEIKELVLWRKREAKLIVTMQNDMLCEEGVPGMGYEDEQGASDDYECPSCCRVLCTTRGEAIMFLAGVMHSQK